MKGRRFRRSDALRIGPNKVIFHQNLPDWINVKARLGAVH